MSTATAILEDILQAARDRDDYQGGGQRLSATGHCLRQQYYDALEYEGSSNTAVSLLEIHDGNIHEADVKDLLRRAGYTVGREEQVEGRNEGDEIQLELEDGSIVKGHIDGEISGPNLYVPFLLEIKAMSGLRFVDFATNGLEQAHPEYYQQIQGYMAAEASNPKAQPWPGCVFVAKAKDSSAVRMRLRGMKGDSVWNPMKNKKTYSWKDLAACAKLCIEVVPFDPDAAESVMGRQSQLAYHLAHSTVPDRDYKKSDWHCRYCNHFDRCWNED